MSRPLVPDRVEVASVEWHVGLPDERSRQLLLLLFRPPGERDDDGAGEADEPKEGKTT